MLFFPTDPNLLAVDRAVGAKGAVLDEAEFVHYLKNDHFTSSPSSIKDSLVMNCIRSPPLSPLRTCAPPEAICDMHDNMRGQGI